jgi:hypothetical protein
MEKQEIQQSMNNVEPSKAIQYIIDNAPKFAEAKANRIYIENFLKVKKAEIAIKCNESSMTRAEQHALSHPDYKLLLDGLKVAIVQEEHLRWWLEAARLRVEVWRTQEASNRGLDRAVR